MPGRHRKPSRQRAAGRHRKPPQRARWAVPAVAAVASVGFGGVAAATALTGGSEQGTASPPRLPAVATTPATPPAPHVSVTRIAAQQSPTTRVSAVQVARPILVVTAVGRDSWVEVVASGHHVLFQGQLHPGRTMSFGTHPLSLLLSDTGAVRVVVRGQARQLAGRRGQVFILRIS